MGCRPVSEDTTDDAALSSPLARLRKDRVVGGAFRDVTVTGVHVVTGRRGDGGGPRGIGFCVLFYFSSVFRVPFVYNTPMKPWVKLKFDEYPVKL